MNRAQFNISSFLKNGALLRVGSDQFNLITGPFSTVALTEQELKSQFPLVYQPYFWDFLQPHRQTLFVSQGQQSHFFTRKELLKMLAEADPIQPELEWQSLNPVPFKEQFDWSQKEFAFQRLQKTVPIVCQKSLTQLSPDNLAWILSCLLSENLTGWTYGFWQNGSGYLGQTPELIAEWSASTHVLKTAALAGTLKNTPENEVLIQTDPKIRTEHNFVVADIVNQLKKTISENQIQQQTTHVEKLKHLLHLKTDFQCNSVNTEQALQAIQNLHPTAALGVYPRIQEKMLGFSKLGLQDERNNFAAPFAFIQTEKILCVASIRNLFFSEKELRIFSGCGVTQESKYESELSELQLKRDSVKKMMGLLND